MRITAKNLPHLQVDTQNFSQKFIDKMCFSKRIFFECDWRRCSYLWVLDWRREPDNFRIEPWWIGESNVHVAGSFIACLYSVLHFVYIRWRVYENRLSLNSEVKLKSSSEFVSTERNEWKKKLMMQLARSGLFCFSAQMLPPWWGPPWPSILKEHLATWVYFLIALVTLQLPGLFIWYGLSAANDFRKSGTLAVFVSWELREVPGIQENLNNFVEQMNEW